MSTKVKNNDAMKFVNSIEDLESKKILLDERRQKLLEKEQEEAKNNNTVGPLLVWLKNVSLAEYLYNCFGIPEWDKKRISLEENERTKFLETIKNINSGKEISEEDLKFYGIVKLPYPKFVSRYYDKYFQNMSEFDQEAVADESFAYKLYVSSDLETEIMDKYIKRIGKIDFNATNDLLHKSLGNYAKTKMLSQNTIYSLRLLYILKYADDEMLKNNGFATGSIEDKINLFNEPIRNIITTTVGITNGGHCINGKEARKRTKIDIKSHVLSDIYDLILYRTKGELINTLRLPEDVLDDTKGYYFPKKFQLNRSKQNYRTWEVNKIIWYYRDLLSDDEKKNVEKFLTVNDDLAPQRLLALIAVHKFVTQDFSVIEKIMNLNNTFGHHKSFYEKVIADYYEFTASLKEEKESSEKTLK